MGLIARQLEAAGIPTTSLSSARDITAAANPPRAAFVDYPLGHTSGRVAEPELNRTIVAAALGLLDEVTEAGTIVDLPHTWADTDDWKDGVMRVTTSASGEKSTEDDRVARLDTPVYQAPSDEAAAASTHAGESCLVCAGIDY